MNVSEQQRSRCSGQDDGPSGYDTGPVDLGIDEEVGGVGRRAAPFSRSAPCVTVGGARPKNRTSPQSVRGSSGVTHVARQRRTASRTAPAAAVGRPWEADGARHTVTVRPTVPTGGTAGLAGRRPAPDRHRFAVPISNPSPTPAVYPIAGTARAGTDVVRTGDVAWTFGWWRRAIADPAGARLITPAHNVRRGTEIGSPKMRTGGGTPHGGVCLHGEARGCPGRAEEIGVDMPLLRAVPATGDGPGAFVDRAADGDVHERSDVGAA